MSRQPHILNASTNLLGICFVIITGLKLTNANSLSWADEITWSASVFFISSILLSYLALRHDGQSRWREQWAERTFLFGVAGLTLAIFTMAVSIEWDDYERVSAQPSRTHASPTTTPARTSDK